MGARMGEVVAGIGTTNTAPMTPYEAVIANTATQYPQDVYIKIPSLDQGRSLKGAVRWSPIPGPNGPIYPTKDDIAQVVRTNEGFYWVTQFVPQTYPALAVTPRARVHNSALGVGVGGSWTTMNDMWDTEDYDTSNIHDLTSGQRFKLVCSSAGVWSAKAQVVWSQNATGDRGARIIHHASIGGTETLIGELEISPAPASSFTQMQVDGGSWFCSINDYFYVQVIQTSGVSVDLQIRSAATPGCWFQIEKRV